MGAMIVVVMKERQEGLLAFAGVVIRLELSPTRVMRFDAWSYLQLFGIML